MASNTVINRIGDVIRDQSPNTEEYQSAVTKLNIWRENHGAPMDYYYDICVRIAKQTRKGIVVTQRLKRLPTIIDKLRRFPKMRLSSMQDIAGVRIIVKDMAELVLVEEQLCQLDGFYRSKDYIATPRDSGYRGKHFIFKRNGAFIEVQLRTFLQHLWATSVETMDVFLGTSMKTSSSATYWQNFFQQTSSIFAYAENCPIVPVHEGLTIIDVYKKFAQNMQKHEINNQLRTYAHAAVVQEGKTRNSYYAVMNLKPVGKRKGLATVLYYREADYDLAFQKYRELEEQNGADGNTVLVAINNIKKIREAYPNYFTDLSEFATIINVALDFFAEKI